VILCSLIFKIGGGAKGFLILFLIGIIFLIKIVSALSIDYVSPTPSNDTTTNKGTIEINISIVESVLDSFRFIWGGINYTFLDDTLLLMMNLNNQSLLGENSSRVVDQSNWGNNGTVLGAKWNSSGKFGGGYEFDGINDYINTTTILGSESQFTVSAWFLNKGNDTNTGEVGTAQSIISKSEGSQRKFLIYYNYNTQTLAAITNSTSVSKNSVLRNSWNHLVFVYNYTNSTSNYAQLFVNGNLVSTDSSVGITNASLISVKIGSETGSNRFFNGTIDEVKIWNKSLSAGEVSQEYWGALSKYDPDNWNFYTNISLIIGSLNTYYASIFNSSNAENFTERRVVTDSRPLCADIGAEGDGFVETECLITTCIQLQNMSLNLTRNYKLNNSIDCSETINWNSGNGFSPIGTSSTPFYGNFSGNNKTISNLYINRSSTDYIGLFGFVGNGSTTIKNIGVVNATIIGQQYSGALFGEFRGLRVLDSYATGNVQGQNHIGILGGITRGGYINNTYAIGNVKGVVYTGGLVGVNKWRSPTDSFIGDNNTIENSYAIVNITQLNLPQDVYGRLGGLTGVNYQWIKNSFSIANISCYNCTSVGWHIGSNYDNEVQSTTNNYYYNRSDDFNATGTNIGTITPIENEIYFTGDVNEKPPFNQWGFFSSWQEIDNGYPVLTWQGTGTSVISQTDSPTTTSSSSSGDPSFSISNEKIENGFEKVLYLNWEVNFKLKNETHRFKLKNISTNSATITISSNPITKTFSIGEEKKFDLNQDLYYDLYVKLNSIKINSLKKNFANFTIMSINEKISENNSTANISEDKSSVEQSSKINYFWIYLIGAVLIIIGILFRTFCFKKKKKK